MDKRNILFIGGDERQIYCAKHLFEKGYEISFFGFETYHDLPADFMVFSNPKIAVILADVIVLPTPVSVDSYLFAPFSDKKIQAEQIFRFFDTSKTVFCGKATQTLIRYSEQKRIAFFDFLADESIVLQNAYLTAEGTLFRLMQQSKESLFGKGVLIIGFGRIAKNLIHLLLPYKINITVAARKKSDLTWAKLWGCKSVHISQMQNPNAFDYVINTVPVQLLQPAVIENAKTPYIDLAYNMHIKNETYAYLGGIPGKYAPVTAGLLMGEYIEKTLAEVGHE